MKGSNGKFVFLLDGYDELKLPRNMYESNKLGDWGGTVKVIMTSRKEYLSNYGNYLQYFQPKDCSVGVLFEYRISDVSRA